MSKTIDREHLTRRIGHEIYAELVLKGMDAELSDPTKFASLPFYKVLAVTLANLSPDELVNVITRVYHRNPELDK